MTEKLFTKNFTLLIFGAANLIVWEFYTKTGVIHVYTGSDWFSSHICRDTVCCYNPGHSFVTAWRHLGRQGRQTEYYGSVKRIDWHIGSLFECFIKLSYQRMQNQGGVFQTAKQDFLSSMRYISKEQTSISKMLLLTAFSRFFVMGITIVGLPFLVRTVLGFNPKYYGAAESALAVATILGSIAAGILAEKLKIHKLSILLASLGIFIIPAGIVFLLPVNAMIKYGVTVVSFCGMQAVISIFSIFAVSLIQQRTPNHLIGKVMAYTSTVTLCVQPIGQIVYGFLFDRFYSAVYFVLIPTGIIVCIVGLSAMSFFKNMEREQQEVSA